MKFKLICLLLCIWSKECFWVSLNCPNDNSKRALVWYPFGRRSSKWYAGWRWKLKWNKWGGWLVEPAPTLLFWEKGQQNNLEKVLNAFNIDFSW